MEDDQVLDAIKKLDARRLHEEPHEEDTLKYPKEIYKGINGKELSEPERLWGEGINRRRSYDLGHEAGYAKCLADQSDPLAGYSNLTEAISAGEPIDYEKLDGLKVKCVHPVKGARHGTLKRDSRFLHDHSLGWWCQEVNGAYIRFLIESWNGYNGWELWVEGDIPMCLKTADQLEVGTYFRGHPVSVTSDTPRLMYVGEALGLKIVLYTPRMGKSEFPASEWVVLEEYGPFQKPEDK